MQRLYSKYRIIPFNEYIIKDDEDKSTVFVWKPKSLREHSDCSGKFIKVFLQLGEGDVGHVALFKENEELILVQLPNICVIASSEKLIQKIPSHSKFIPANHLLPITLCPIPAIEKYLLFASPCLTGLIFIPEKSCQHYTLAMFTFVVISPGGWVCQVVYVNIFLLPNRKRAASKNVGDSSHFNATSALQMGSHACCKGQPAGRVTAHTTVPIYIYLRVMCIASIYAYPLE